MRSLFFKFVCGDGECRRGFRKLSGLAQHLESGGCDHARRIRVLKGLVKGVEDWEEVYVEILTDQCGGNGDGPPSLS